MQNAEHSYLVKHIRRISLLRHEMQLPLFVTNHAQKIRSPLLDVCSEINSRLLAWTTLMPGVSCQGDWLAQAHLVKKGVELFQILQKLNTGGFLKFFIYFNA